MKSAAFLPLCLGVIAFAQPSISEDGVWKDFTIWLQRQPPNSKPGDLIRFYRESLLRRGIPERGDGWELFRIPFSRAVRESNFFGIRSTLETTPSSFRVQS